MNTFRQMILSQITINIAAVAIGLILFFATLGKRSRRVNIFLGIAAITCAILTVVFSIRAYQLSY